MSGIVRASTSKDAKRTQRNIPEHQSSSLAAFLRFFLALACDGSFFQDLNALWCPSCPKPGHNPGAGATVQAQLWYRDPANTSNQTTSLSDAIEFVVAP